MRRPRLNSAVATVAVETVFNLLRVASLSFVIAFSLSFVVIPERSHQRANPESRDSPRRSAHLRSGPSDHPGITVYLHRPVRFHVQRVDRMAARHIEADVVPVAPGDS